MQKTQILIYYILGPTLNMIQPLAEAIDLAAQLIFEQRIFMEDISITKDIYPGVAARLHERSDTVSRCIERLSKRCWEEITARGLSKKFIGKSHVLIQSPKTLIVCLAVYNRFDKSIIEVWNERPDLLNFS